MTPPTTTEDVQATDAAVAAQQGLGPALQAYVSRVRGGEVGALPAVLGVVALVVLFTAIEPDTFATTFNFANLLNQSAAVIFIAMGLVFVLLLGEIDLSAGFTSGVAASVLAVLVTQHNLPWGIGVAGTIATGAFIGLVIGVLVAWLGIPSFVVTLAAFLGLQGVLLLVIGQGGTIPVRDVTLLKLMNNQLPPVAGWALAVVVVVGFALSVLSQVRKRMRAGLPTESNAVVLAKIGAVAVVVLVVTYVLNLERSTNPTFRSLKGVPVIVPFTLFFLVVLSFVLSRTGFGRHIYAVGGNEEAARRAGINVLAIKVSCFVIGSTMASIAGIIFASRDNSVSPTTGGAQTLLFAVGAAVIGGTSLFGGRGRVYHAILGGLVVAIIANGLPLITSESGIQFVVTGLVLLLAASVDALSRRRAAATGR